MIECIQHPGDTIFVPGGWWHAVLNLDDTMAVTQNFCGTANFDRVWQRLRVSRKKLSEYFLRCLRAKEPEYYKKALKINKKDKFVFYNQKKRGNFLLDISTATFTDSTSSSSSSSSYPSEYSDPEDEEKNKKKAQEKEEAKNAGKETSSKDTDGDASSSESTKVKRGEGDASNDEMVEKKINDLMNVVDQSLKNDHENFINQ